MSSRYSETGAHDLATYSFGLTTAEVERLRRILARLENREVSLEEAWERAAELMALAKTMLEVLATQTSEATVPTSSKVDPGEGLTPSPQSIN